MKYILVFLVINYLWLSCEYIGSRKRERIFNAISFCEECKTYQFQDCINISQSENDIPSDCQIQTNDEWEIAETILEIFKKDLSSKYYRRTLPYMMEIKSNRLKNYFFITNTLTDIDYLMYYMCFYLTENMTQLSISGHRMYNCSGQDRKYISVSYTMTDFAVVFHKLLLISYIHCGKAKIDGYEKYKAENIKNDIIRKCTFFTK